MEYLSSSMKKCLSLALLLSLLLSLLPTSVFAAAGSDSSGKTGAADAEYTVSFTVLGDPNLIPPMVCGAQDAIELLTAEGPENFDFLGWVTVDYDFVETLPENILTGSCTVEADMTLKALFHFTARAERYTKINGKIAQPYWDPFTGELFYMFKDRANDSAPEEAIYLKAADLDAVYALVQNGQALGVVYYERNSNGEIVPVMGNFSYSVQSLIFEIVEWDCYTTLPHSHSFGDWSSNDDGTHSRSCTFCGATETEACSFESVVTPPTENEQGYTTHTCTVCGYSYVDSWTDPIGIEYTVSFTVLGNPNLIPPMICGSQSSITLPTAEGPEDYEFLGWVTEDYNLVHSLPEPILTGSYTAEADITLKALFQFTARPFAPVKINGHDVVEFYDALTGELFYGILERSTESSPLTYIYLKASDIDAFYELIQQGISVGFRYYEKDSNGCFILAESDFAYRVSSIAEGTVERICYTTLPHSHSFGDWGSNDDSTHSRSCAFCGLSETEACSFESEVTPPTVTEQGYTTHTCTVCGYSYADDWTDPIGIEYTVSFTVLGNPNLIPPMICGSQSPITLPTAEGPEDYEFLGWVTDDYNLVRSLPEPILTGSYTAEADITLKALFQFTARPFAPVRINNHDVVEFFDALTGELFYGLLERPSDSSPLTYVYLKASDIDDICELVQQGISYGVTYYREDSSGCFIPVEGNFRYTVRSITEGTVERIYYTTLPHSHTPGPVTIEQEAAPTCTEAGSRIEVTHCTFCGAELTRETVPLPALGHLPGEPAVENYVEPTDSEAGGYDTVVSCTRCGEELSREHTVIPCLAEPIETSDLHIYSSISVGADMVVTFSARKNDLTNCDSFWIEVVKHAPEGDVIYRYGTGQEGALNEAASSWNADFTHVYAKEMGLNIEARLYAEDAEGRLWMSPSRTICIRDYLAGRLTATTNKVEQRVLAADMLNYGAAAQMYMDYETDHLVNEELTETQLAKLNEYETKNPPVVEKTNSNIRPAGAANVLFNSVSLDNEVILTLTVRANAGDTVKVLMKDHDSGMVLETLDTVFSGSTFSVDYTGLGADKMRVAYDFTAQINGVEIGNTRTWSIEGYVGEIRNSNNQTKINMANALLTYGDSAAAYFAAQ